MGAHPASRKKDSQHGTALAPVVGMRVPTPWIARVVLATVAAGGLVVACQHEARGPTVTPIRREAPPLGASPASSTPSCTDCADAGVGSLTPGPLSIDGVQITPAQSTRSE